jgi:hypothetical protein
MAPTLVATAGSASANSFATVAEGDTYCDARLNATAWGDETNDEKARALIQATLELNTYTYIGTTVTTTQALVWPRQWAVDPDSPLGDYFDTTEIPTRLKNATCELALQYIIAGTTDLSLLDSTAGVIEKTIGPITTRWASPTLRPTTLIQRFPLVQSLIRPLLVVQGHSVPLVRG